MKLKEPPPNRAPQRPEWPRWTEDKAGDKLRRVSVPLGLAITVIVHLLFVEVVPWDRIGVIDKEPERNPPLEVEFLPPLQPVPEFVQTNPIAPEEKPEDSDKISSQDQVAAQEEPDPTQDSDTPRIDGEEMESDKIVQGDVLAEPQPPAMAMNEPTPSEEPSTLESDPLMPDEGRSVQMDAPTVVEPSDEVLPSENQQETADAAQESKPEYLEQEPTQADPGMEEQKAVEVEEAPEAEEGFMAATETGEAEVKVEETVEETAQPETGKNERIEVYMEEVVTQPTEQSSPSSTPSPQSRPRLNFVRTTSGPLKYEPRSSNKAGFTQVDANFDKFGAYLQRMQEAVQQQWWLVARSQSTILAELGSRVVVRYKLSRQGEITNMEVLYSSASRSGTVICMEAIQSRAPFGVWTEEMVRTLGEEQTITFTFHYR